MDLIQRDGLFLEVLVEEQLRASRLTKMLAVFSGEI